MKKIFILALMIILLVSGNVYANQFDSMLTTSRFNGRAVKYYLENDVDGIGKTVIESYILGVVSTIAGLHNEHYNKLYPNIIYDDVINKVILFYQNNPNQRYKSILEVVLTGCK